MTEILLGSHVGMSGKEMFLGSVKEAAEYGANTLMVYTVDSTSLYSPSCSTQTTVLSASSQ